MLAYVGTQHSLFYFDAIQSLPNLDQPDHTISDMGPYGTDIDAEPNLTSISSYWSLVASTFYSALPFFYFLFLEAQ
jgi:hypothetical protein